MKRNVLIKFFVLAIVLAIPVLAHAQAVTPEALVKDLYRAHNTKYSNPFFQTRRRALLDKYFTRSLADLIWKDAVDSAKTNEIGAIDGDPLYNAQDMEIKKFAVGKADIKGNNATVAVTFTNFGKAESIKFDLKKVGTAWKIDDIEYGGEDGTMRSWFKESTGPVK